MKICYSCFSELPAGTKICPDCGCSVDLKNEEKYPYALPCGTALNGSFQTTYDFRNEVLSKMEPLSDEDGGAPLPQPEDPDKIIFKETRKKAASGDPEAQFMLGYLYEMGKGGHKDEKEAVKWYRKAAEQGNVAGKRSLERLKGTDQMQPGQRADKDDGQKKEENGKGKKPKAPESGPVRSEEKNKPEEGDGGGSAKWDQRGD